MARYRNNIYSLKPKKQHPFKIYDAGFYGTYRNDAEQFLLCGRQLLMSTHGIADSHIALAKISDGQKAVILYVDRDTYELVFRDNHIRKHLCGWYLASEWRGLNMKDVEQKMYEYLSCNAKKTTISSPPPNKRKCELREEDGDPPIIQELERDNVV